MNLISLAISVLWLLIGVIIILGIIWLALYVVKMFVPVPERIEQIIWVVILILILIAVLTLLTGGGGMHSFRFSELKGGALAAIPWTAARHYAARKMIGVS